ncbi:MAG: hypothetical protein WCT17_06035, partial [Bacilli bacterium]
LEKTPAQIFNEGNWTYSTFKEYSIAAQTALDGLWDASPTRKYYAVAGCSTYYWVGMTSAGGEKIIDASNRAFHPLTSTSLDAALTLRQIYEAGAMDPNKQVDAGVVSWNNGRALFSSGFKWFVNSSTRWKEDLWTPGNSGTTRYGYVPFPRPDELTKDEQRLGVGGTNTWVMPIGRDYSGYGPQCTAENIYRVVVKAMQLTDEYHVNSIGYDKDQELQAYAEKYTESLDSVSAFTYISKRASDIGFFEPLTEANNHVVNTGYSSFSTAINDYVMGHYASLSDALFDLNYAIITEIRLAFE